MSQQYQWFIKPLDAKTNEYISMYLSAVLRNDGCCFEISDSKGSPHPVWQVEHRDIELMQNSKKGLGLRFRVFNREGHHGQLREWKFPKKSARKIG